MADEKRSAGITIIAIGKLCKAVALVGIGIGARVVSGHDAHKLLGHWADLLRIDPHNHYLEHGIATISGQSPQKLHAISIGTFVYAALFLTEGLGLWFKKHWAEWFTVIITTSFIPLEVWEIAKEPSGGKIVALVLNVAAVIYLLFHRLRAHEKPAFRWLIPARS